MLVPQGVDAAGCSWMQGRKRGERPKISTLRGHGGPVGQWTGRAKTRKKLKRPSGVRRAGLPAKKPERIKGEKC